MSTSKMSKAFKVVQKTLSKHSPEILTGIGIAGMVTTTILAVKATPKAVELIKRDSRKNHDGDPHAYTKVEAIKSCWKCYIPAVISGGVSVACLVGANSVHARRNAALATAYKISETALLEYKDGVIETIGEKKEKEVCDNINKKRIEENPVSNNEVHITAKGDTLCYDYLSGRYFKTDIDSIKRTENELNKRMLHDIIGFTSLNDFYINLGLDPVGIGYDLGWNTENLIDIRLGTQLADDGQPCVVIDHVKPPIYGYDK